MAVNFNYVKKGYDPTEVDAYINNLESVVNSYKEKDASIKNAIVSSQVAGDAIVAEAKAKADEIVAGSLKIVSEIAQRMSGQRKVIEEFKNDYEALIKKYTCVADEDDFTNVYTKIEELERYCDEVRNTDKQEDNYD